MAVATLAKNVLFIWKNLCHNNNNSEQNTVPTTYEIYKKEGFGYHEVPYH